MALWQSFYDQNPLADFTPSEEVDMQGWNSEGPIFDLVLTEAQPKLIIEVGTWKGRSAINMAWLCDADILCIDTWLGSAEVFLDEDRMQLDSLKRKHGWPQLYYTFASNVVRHGLQERICPLALPSTVAAEVLRAKGIKADVVYLDGSHAERDVKRDLEDYWPLVRDGGVLFGDDYNWRSVRSAVDEFFGACHVQSFRGKYMVRR